MRRAARVVLAALALTWGAAALAQIQSVVTYPGGSTGQLEYNNNSRFGGVPNSSVRGSTVAVAEIRASTAAFGNEGSKSTFSYTGALQMANNAGITLSGPNSFITVPSSITGSHFGDGSHLTGLVSSAAVAAAAAAVQADLAAHTVETSTHGATALNTASRIVMRDGSGNFAAGTITAALTGNATTASALAANGGNCSSGTYPLGVDAAGAAESCGSDINGNAATATALAANGTNAGSGRIALGVDASGNAETGHVEDGAAVNGSTAPATSNSLFDGLATKQDLDDDLTDLADGTLTGSKVGSGVPAANIANGTMGTVNTGGNAATATALAANGTNCSAGNYPLGVDASGNAESCTAVSGGTVSTFTHVNLPASTYNPTNTTFGACLTGSTGTVTNADGEAVEISANLYTVPNGGNPYFLTILVDGQIITGGSGSSMADSAIATCWQNGGSSYDPCPITTYTISPAAGQHHYCIAAAVNGGTGDIRCGIAKCYLSVRTRR